MTRTLLLDADGNLFPSEEPAFVASAEVTNAFLAAVGIGERFEPEQLRLATTGKNFRTTAADLAAAHGVQVEDAVLQHWVDEERVRVTEHLARVLEPDPSVLGPLTQLAAVHPLAAVSSSATSRLAACFTAAGLDELIPASRRYSAEDSLPKPTSKPDPAIYLHACVDLGIHPKDAVAVEDSVPGVESAVAAGIRTIGNVQFVTPVERDERIRFLEKSGAEVVVSSWAAVQELLAQ